MLVWAFVVPLALARWLDATTGGNNFVHPIWLPLIYVTAMLVGYGCAAVAHRAVFLYLRNIRSVVDRHRRIGVCCSPLASISSDTCTSITMRKWSTRQKF